MSTRGEASGPKRMLLICGLRGGERGAGRAGAATSDAPSQEDDEHKGWVVDGEGAVSALQAVEGEEERRTLAEKFEQPRSVYTVAAFPRSVSACCCLRALSSPLPATKQHRSHPPVPSLFSFPYPFFHPEMTAQRTAHRNSTQTRQAHLVFRPRQASSSHRGPNTLSLGKLPSLAWSRPQRMNRWRYCYSRQPRICSYVYPNDRRWIAAALIPETPFWSSQSVPPWQFGRRSRGGPLIPPSPIAR